MIQPIDGVPSGQFGFPGMMHPSEKKPSASEESIEVNE